MKSHGYKRRRASYRGKVGTKTGLDARRELIAKQMSVLTEDDGWALPDDDPVSGGRHGTQPHDGSGQAKRHNESWWRYTDALAVRDMDSSREDRDERSGGTSYRHDELSSRRRSASRTSSGANSRELERSRHSRQHTPRSRSNERRTVSRDVMISDRSRSRGRDSDHDRLSRGRSSRDRRSTHCT